MSTKHWITGVLVTAALAGTAQGSELEFHPAIAVNEEYNDNVFYTTHNRVTDYITHAVPSITSSYKAPILTVDLNYMLDYMYYANGSVGSNLSHNLTATGKLTAVENLLYLDASDTYSRVSIDATRDVTMQSPLAGQVDQNVVNISPYVTLRPTLKTKVKAGYRYVDIRYNGISGGSAFTSLSVTDHVAFLDTAYEFTSKWSATGGYSFTLQQSGADEYHQHQGNVGFRYEYSNKSFLFGQAGYTWTKFNNNRSLDDLFWNAGFTHTFDTVTATVNTGVTYTEDPLLLSTIQNKNASISLDKTFPVGSMGLSFNYSEITAAESKMLLTRMYGGKIQGGYEFTSDLKGNVGFTAEKYDNETIPGGTATTYTRRFLVNSGFTYQLGDQFSVSLNYIYVDSHSPGIPTDNASVNRVTLALAKTF